MKDFLRENWIVIIILASGVILVGILGTNLVKTQIDATFTLKNMEKISPDNYVMSIGEETLLEWQIEPEMEDVKLSLPKGLQHLGGELTYKKGNEGVRVRAVKVGKWKLGVEHGSADYSPSQDYFVCIGVTEEDAREFCD